MSDTKVVVDGDSKGAVKALKDVEGAAKDVAAETDRAAEKSEKLRESIDGLKSAAGGLVAAGALAAAAIGVSALVVSTQQYVSTSASARREMEGTQHALSNLTASIGEAIWGGNNAEAMFGALARASNEATLAVQENDEATQEVARVGMSLLIDSAGLVVAAVSEMAKWSDRLSDQMTLLGEEVSMFAAIASDAGTAVANLFRETDKPLSAMTEWHDRQEDLNVILDSGREKTDELTKSLDDLASGLARSASGLRGGGEDLSGYRAEVDALLNSIALIRGFIDRENAAPRPPSSAGPREPDIDAEKAFGFEMAALARTRETLLAQIREAAKTNTLEKQIAAYEIEKEAAEAHAAALIEIEQSAADKRTAIADRELAETQRIFDARQAAAEDYGYAIGNLLVDLTDGQGTALEAMRSFVAQELQMKGIARFAEGFALSFVPGQFVQGAKLMAAGGGMIATAAAIGGGGAGGGGGGASAASVGAAPLPASASSGNQTNVRTDVTFGVVGDPREAARQVADLNKIAVREGMQ